MYSTGLRSWMDGSENMVKRLVLRRLNRFARLSNPINGINVIFLWERYQLGCSCIFMVSTIIERHAEEARRDRWKIRFIVRKKRKINHSTTRTGGVLYDNKSFSSKREQLPCCIVIFLFEAKTQMRRKNTFIMFPISQGWPSCLYQWFLDKTWSLL